jgi:hypothetical protein
LNQLENQLNVGHFDNLHAAAATACIAGHGKVVGADN